MNLLTLQDQALDDFERWRILSDQSNPEEAIREIADHHVPVVDGELIRLAVMNPELATTEPELGPVFEGTTTAVNLIAANVFETLRDTLTKRWEDYQRAEAPGLHAAG